MGGWRRNAIFLIALLGLIASAGGVGATWVGWSLNEKRATEWMSETPAVCLLASVMDANGVWVSVVCRRRVPVNTTDFVRETSRWTIDQSAQIQTGIRRYAVGIALRAEISDFTKSPHAMVCHPGDCSIFIGMTLEQFMIGAGVLLLASTFIAWRTFPRHLAPGACSACRYDLSGLPPMATCPECGRIA